ALIGAILGYAAGFALGLAIPGTDREGRRATLAAFAAGPLGAVAGAGLGGWLFAAMPLLALLPPALGAALLLAWTRHRARRPLGLNRAAPRLQVEIASPVPLRSLT